MLGQLQQVPSPVQGAPAGDLARGCGDQAQDGHHAHRLAAAALAHDGQCLSLAQFIGDAVHRVDGALWRVETRS